MTPSQPRPQKLTRASRVCADLRAAILRGDLAPGERLIFDQLRDRFGLSLSPLREAVSRLVADGLVEMEDQRGFRVAPVSMADLVEITETRREIEPLALGQAIDRGDLEWEGRVMSALHRLNRIRRDPADPASIEAWETAHQAFHGALLDGAGRPLLTGFCRRLNTLNDRYRRMLIRRGGGAHDVAAEHAAIAQAAIARERDRAQDLLRRHIERTGHGIAQGIGDLLPSGTA